jgi:uncharacterized C2H2 Zn-finger protein
MPCHRRSPEAYELALNLTGPEKAMFHELPDVDPSTGCRFTCRGCYFLAVTFEEMVDHVRSIHAPQEFRCPYCKKVYGSKNSLQNHISLSHRVLHAQAKKKY